MMYITKEINISNFGRVLYSEAPFDDALKAIQTKGGQIITAEQLAFARMQKGKNHPLSTNGSYIQEGILYVPNSKHQKILVKNSLILLNPQIATQAHREDKEYMLEGNFDINAFLEQNNNVLFLDNTNAIPTDRFGEDERMIWIFGIHAKNYGLFLKDANISKTTFYTDETDIISSQKFPYMNQLWIRRIDSDSNIIGKGKDLHDNYRVCGMLVTTSETSTKKNSIANIYTTKKVQNNVAKTLRSVGIIDNAEKTIISNLEKRLK